MEVKLIERYSTRSATGYTGVILKKDGKFEARYKHKFIGTYDTAEAASDAFLRVAEGKEAPTGRKRSRQERVKVPRKAAKPKGKVIRRYSNTLTGYKGVFRARIAWSYFTKANGTIIGYYDTAEEASDAYVEHMRSLYPDATIIGEAPAKSIYKWGTGR